MSNSVNQMAQELSRELKISTDAMEATNSNGSATPYLQRKLTQLQQEIALDNANQVDDMEIELDVNAQIRKFDEIRKQQKDLELAQFNFIRQQQRELNRALGIVPRCAKKLTFS